MFKARALVWTCVFLGFITGVVLSVAPPSWASRNSSGTYSLPTGNPVVTATSITSTWANTTLSDIKTEITSSLDRAGRGAMTAPLQHSSGSLALPSVTFSGQTSSGLYLAAASDVRMSVGAASAQTWAATGTTFPLACTVTGAFTGAAGATVTQSTANTAGATITGNGSGEGAIITGGSTGVGVVVASGGGNAYAASFTGSGSGAGAQLTGGTTGQGLVVQSGTSATGGTRQDAIRVVNGDIDLSSVANPTSTTAVSERVTPLNIVKAWALITVTNGSPAITAGFNSTSVSCSANTVRLTMASAMASTNYAVFVTNSNALGYVYRGLRSTTTIAIASAYDATAAHAVVDLCNAATNDDFYIQILGAQ